MQAETSMPGYRMYEFLLVLVPHDDLQQKIIKVKQAFYDHYQVPAALVGRPQVTLLRYQQPELMEERILSRLRLVAMGLPPLKIELNGFGNYPMHSFFINIANKNQVKLLVNGFKPLRRLLQYGLDKPHFIEDPCIPVAIKISKDIFKKALPVYEQKHFTGRFIANEIVVLKRRKDDKKYKIAERLQLQHLPVHTVQGALF